MFIVRFILLTVVCCSAKGRKIMKYILLSCTLLLTQTFADVSARTTTPEEKVRTESSHFISKRRKRPVMPAHKYYLLNHDHYYYTNVMSNCNKYLRIIEQKDKEIEVLKNEINRLRGTTQESLQKNLKEEYEMKIKKFDERKSGIRTQNSMRISTEPIEE